MANGTPGPWDDYKTAAPPSTEAGPWTDYQSAKPAAASAAPPAQRNPVAPEQGPVMRYLSGLWGGTKAMLPSMPHSVGDAYKMAFSAGSLQPLMMGLREVQEYKQARQEKQPVPSALASSVGGAIGLDPEGIRQRALKRDFAGIAGEATPSIVATLIGGELAKDPSLETQYRDIHKLMETTPKDVRLGGDISGYEQANKIPARGLLKEGLNKDVLKSMTPLERRGAIRTKWNEAGKAIDRTLIDATSNNVTVNPTTNAMQVIDSISDPKLREAAINRMDFLMEEMGFQDVTKITPLEAWRLRDALKAGARFGPSGDLSSLSKIRARLYSAVSKDLQDAVPGLKDLDKHYGDMTGAKDAAERQAQKYIAPPKKAPMSTAKKVAIGAGIAAAGATAEALGGKRFRDAVRTVLP